MTFIKWVEYTGAIYDGTKGEFNWWGAPQSADYPSTQLTPKKKKKRSKKLKRNG